MAATAPRRRRRGGSGGEAAQAQQAPCRAPPPDHHPDPSQQHPALGDLDPATRFLYTPHTLICLVLGEG